MLKCTLADFFTNKAKEHANTNNLNDAYKLYIVRDNLDQVLYIGIARSGIRARWFHHHGGHISMQCKDSCYIFTPSLESDIGGYIYDMLPLSLEWIIEMWSLNDCIEFLKGDLHTERIRMWDIEGAEPEMIHKLKPYFNVHYNNGSDKEWDIKWFDEPPHPYYCIWDGLVPINMRFAKHPVHDDENKKTAYDTLVIY